MSPVVWSPDRDVPTRNYRKVPAVTFWTAYAAALCALAWVGAENMRSVPEVPEIEETLPPIVVTREDPFPCMPDSPYRLTYERVGAVCPGVTP